MSGALAIAYDLATRTGFDNLTHYDEIKQQCMPFWDCRGFPTIGYGRLLSRKRYTPLTAFSPITKPEAEAYVLSDLAKALNSVRKLIKVPLNDNQAAALADFVFNLGGAQLEWSQLRTKLNRGEYDEVPAQLRRFIYSAHVREPGLVKRRDAEVQLWNAAVAA